MQSNEKKNGRIEVICGSMFSGKTEELIHRLKMAKIAKKEVEIFKPSIETRYSKDQIVSHDNNSIHSISVHNPLEILSLITTKDVIGIDEAQFFDNEIIEIVRTIADKGIRVIIAGLDMDYQGQPFGAMPQLMAIADEVTKRHAICMICGDKALYSKRLIPSSAQILLGEKEAYEPRCRFCNKI